MRRINFFRVGVAAATLALLVIGGCSRDPASPQRHGQIILRAVFVTQNQGLQKTTDLAAVNRVVVTVRRFAYEGDQQQSVGEVVLQQPLTIVTRPEGRFAEGTLSVPLKEDYSCFRITVDAYDNADLAFTGSGVTCFSKEESRASELTINLAPVVPPELRKPGADVIVYADVNLLDNFTIAFGNNRPFGLNLVNFSAQGSNASSQLIKIYEGHNGTRVASQAPYDTLFSMWTRAGYKISETHEESIQPQGYKLIMIFLPGQSGYSPFSAEEIASLKQFAADGGRLVLVGEWRDFYTATGRQTFNQLLSGLGIGLTITEVKNVQQELRTDITPHQVMTNVSSIYNNWTGTFVITNPQTAVALVRSTPNADNNNQVDIVVAIGKVQTGGGG